MENKPGALFNLTRYLSEKNINIEGISIADTADHAIVRLVVDKPNEAIHLLGDIGILVLESELLAVSLTNEPGTLANFCQKLIDMGSSIEYAYGSSFPESSDVTLYIRVVDHSKSLPDPF